MDEQELEAHLQQLFQSAEAAGSEGLTDEAIKRCEQALELLDDNPEEETTYTHTDFLMLAGNSCWEDGDYESSLHYYRQGYEYDPGRLDALVAVGVALFYLCRFSSAKQILEMASAEESGIGEVWYYMALIARREGDPDLGDIFFKRANEHEPDRFTVPKFLSREHIDTYLDEIFAQYPESIRKSLENVAILHAERPSMAMLHASEPPMDPLVLGLFDGTPLPEESSGAPAAGADTIHIFSENIALIAEDVDKLKEELAVTLKHEIGHFLGLDEDELSARGLE